MNLLLFLIAFPALAGLILLGIKNQAARCVVVWGATLAIMAASAKLLFDFGGGAELVQFSWNPAHAGTIMFGLEALIGLFLVWVSLKHKKFLVTLLVIVPLVLMGWFEFTQLHGYEMEQNLFIDKFSLIMALIIGIVGTPIAVFALGYMREFQEHHGEFVKDRRPLFFFILFIFLAAMFGVVFANNLMWLFFFWEVTTLCSFLLIGYKQDQESTDNAFRALWMNLLGGLAFAVGIVLFFHEKQSLALFDLVRCQDKSALLMLPAALLCFAGIAKSAQLPFSSWLLGAMVAPTPVSALLHSSTMVKAGVYLVVRLAPALEGTRTGFLVAVIGGVTFMVGSFIAISQRNAKKVLAWSTIANLGLIILCGGIGTYESVWAAVLLIVFHAIAKCLLFLCVGVAEHKLHSRDIEDMGGMIISLPKLSVLMQLGMAGMFLAPFGMLISKWAALRAVIDYSPLLVLFVIFGSSVTLFFWVKWMGKLLQVVHPHESMDHTICRNQWLPMYLLAALTVLVCIIFPQLSTSLIEPYVLNEYGKTTSLGAGNVLIMLIMIGLLALFPLSFLNYGRKVKVLSAYLGGANIEDSQTHFRGGAGTTREVTLHNYYLHEFFGEAKLLKIGVWIGIVLLAVLVTVQFPALALLDRAFFHGVPRVSVGEFSFGGGFALRVELFLILAPLAGGLIAGVDRIVSARMQGRRGPPVLQSFYDVAKLWRKENIVVRRSQGFYVLFYFIFMLVTGILFFSGGDLLLTVFALTLGAIFLVLGAYKASSPYSFIGAERELLQMMSYEPMLLLVAVGIYMITGSFNVIDIVQFKAASGGEILAFKGPLLLLGLLFILTIKLRKSPFDLSTSHHGHQELVKGITTEFSGKSLALIEITHWYETVLVMGLVWLFFAQGPRYMAWLVAPAAAGVAYFLEILADNACSRVKWQMLLKSSWAVALLFGMLNVTLLFTFNSRAETVAPAAKPVPAAPAATVAVPAVPILPSTPAP